MHGYDLVGVVFIDSMRFVSVADEKVARVFEAPGAFVRSVKNLGVADSDISEVHKNQPILLPDLNPLILAENRREDQSPPAYRRSVCQIKPLPMVSGYIIE